MESNAERGRPLPPLPPPPPSPPPQQQPQQAAGFGATPFTSSSSSPLPRGRAGAKRKRPDTLSVLLQALVGKQVMVELKNDTEVQGFIQDADDGMNLVMENVRCVNKKGVRQSLEVLWVSGRMVRYVHLWEHLDVARTVQRHLDLVEQSARRAAKRPRMKPNSTPQPATAQPIVVVTAGGQQQGHERAADREEQDDEADEGWEGGGVLEAVAR